MVRASGSLAGIVVASRGFGVEDFLSSQPVRATPTNAKPDRRIADRNIPDILMLERKLAMTIVTCIE
jgi:hypothetical protein